MAAFAFSTLSDVYKRQVLTLPDDIQHVWLDIANGGSSQQIEMTLDGKRIPDASGLPSDSSNKTPDISADSSNSSGGLYYVYYTALLPKVEQGQSFEDVYKRQDQLPDIRYLLSH